MSAILAGSPDACGAAAAGAASWAEFTAGKEHTVNNKNANRINTFFMACPFGVWLETDLKTLTAF
jgi:hypothetical protein